MIPRKNELNIKGTKMRHPRYKIARGTYLSGVGQEDKDYYFKIPVVSPYYETIQIDDICVTLNKTVHSFLQYQAWYESNRFQVLSIPYKIYFALRRHRDFQ